MPYSRTIRYGRANYGGVYLAGFWKGGASCGGRIFVSAVIIYIFQHKRYVIFIELINVNLTKDSIFC